MGIVGNNGTGKSPPSSKLLLGLQRPDEGRFDIGETVKFGHYSQDGLQFDEQERVIDIITKRAEYIDLGGGRHLPRLPSFCSVSSSTPQVAVRLCV